MEDGGQSLWRHRKCLLKIFNLHLSVSAMTNLNPMRTRKALTQGKLKGHVKKIVREERTNYAFRLRYGNDLWLKKQSTRCVKSGIQVLP